MPIKNLMLVGLLATILSGCAFTDVQLDMPVSGLEQPITGGNNREVIVSIPFNDTRPHKERCGMKKNGYNMDTADAICGIAPSEWIAQLLVDELRASRFKVLPPHAPHGRAALKIEGDVQKIFVEPVIGMWSGSLETDLQVKLTATTETGLRAERTFFAKGIKKGVIAATRTPFHTSLKRAADELLTEMVEAVFYLMNKYPQIGVPDPVYQPIKPHVFEEMQ